MSSAQDGGTAGPLTAHARIGLKSTGLFIFAGRLVSAITGLVFTVMVARWLAPAGFGTWEVIVTLVTFASYPVGIVAYWATRDVARGRMVGRTALVFGAALSALGLGMYFGFTALTYSKVSSVILPFLLGAILVPLSYWSTVTNSIVQGHRPGVYGYSLVLSEFAKLGVAYEALYVYRLGIEGVIVALMAAYFAQAAISTYMVRVTFTEKFDPSLTRRWSRLAWVPGLSSLQTVLAVADTFVAAVGFGPAIVGYYQVAFAVASVVGYSSALVLPLYPILLRGGGERLPSVGIEFSLLFAIPMAVGCSVLAEPILFLFGSRYTPGALGLVGLAAMFAVLTVSGIMDQTLLGTEKADAREKPSTWELLRSNLSFVPVVNITYGVVYVGSLYAVLSYAFANGFSVSSSVEAWAAVQLTATVVFMLVKARRARRYGKLMPGMSVVYYAVAAAVMGTLVYYVSGAVLNQGLGTVEYGAQLLGLGFAGAAVYFGVVYALDSKFREMARALLGRLSAASRV